MKRFEFRCDGCDTVEHVNLSSVQNIDFMLDGWVTHRIVAFENGEEAHDILSDLCPICSENLRRALNPANWPRMKATARDLGFEVSRLREETLGHASRRVKPFG
jgi:hypothetical protein